MLAKVVVHYDLWWNPAVDSQAPVGRFGLAKPATQRYIDLLTRARWKKKIDAMIRSKRELADLSVSVGET